MQACLVWLYRVHTEIKGSFEGIITFARMKYLGVNSDFLKFFELIQNFFSFFLVNFYFFKLFFSLNNCQKTLFNRFDFLKIATTSTFSAFLNLPFAIFKGELAQYLAVHPHPHPHPHPYSPGTTCSP